MVEKKIRKVISSAKVLEEEAPKQAEEEQVKLTKRSCFFCKSKTNPSYTDLATLRKFLTDRAKILARGRSGTCSKHQRGVARNIKYARHLALLPFVPKV